MSDYSEWVKRQQTITASVSCPRCKAAAGKRCNWGATASGSDEYTANHTPRARKFEEKARFDCTCGWSATGRAVDVRTWAVSHLTENHRDKEGPSVTWDTARGAEGPSE